MRDDQNDVEDARAVNAFDASHLDVGGGGGAGDEGGGEGGGWLQACEGLGDGLDYVGGVDDAEVIVGHEGERAAALIGALQDDGTGLCDGEGCGGEDAVEGIELGWGEGFVEGEGETSGECGGRRIGRDDDVDFAAIV